MSKKLFVNGQILSSGVLLGRLKESLKKLSDPFDPVNPYDILLASLKPIMSSEETEKVKSQKDEDYDEDSEDEEEEEDEEELSEAMKGLNEEGIETYLKMCPVPTADVVNVLRKLGMSGDYNLRKTNELIDLYLKRTPPDLILNLVEGTLDDKLLYLAKELILLHGSNDHEVLVEKVVGFMDGLRYGSIIEYPMLFGVLMSWAVLNESKVSLNPLEVMASAKIPKLEFPAHRVEAHAYRLVKQLSTEDEPEAMESLKISMRTTEVPVSHREDYVLRLIAALNLWVKEPSAPRITQFPVQQFFYLK